MAGMNFFEMDPLRPAVYYIGGCMIGILCMGIVMAAAFLYSKTGLNQLLFSCALPFMALAQSVSVSLQ